MPLVGKSTAQQLAAGSRQQTTKEHLEKRNPKPESAYSQSQEPSWIFYL
jgi:hypothetical protein